MTVSTTISPWLGHYYYGYGFTTNESYQYYGHDVIPNSSFHVRFTITTDGIDHTILPLLLLLQQRLQYEYYCYWTTVAVLHMLLPILLLLLTTYPTTIAQQ